MRLNPSFFSQSTDKDSGTIYSVVMNLFVTVCGIIFLGVIYYLDVLKYFIPNEAYWEGLKIVPILLMANICLGIYYNQSIWYKLSDKTIMGAYIAVFGAIITIVFNLLLVPLLGLFRKCLDHLNLLWKYGTCFFLAWKEVLSNSVRRAENRSQHFNFSWIVGVIHGS